MKAVEQTSSVKALSVFARHIVVLWTNAVQVRHASNNGTQRFILVDIRSEGLNRLRNSDLVLEKI